MKIYAGLQRSFLRFEWGAGVPLRGGGATTTPCSQPVCERCLEKWDQIIAEGKSVVIVEARIEINHYGLIL